MAEAIEIDTFYTLNEEMKEIETKLNDLRRRIGLRLCENTEWDSTYQTSLIQGSLNIRRTVKLLCDDLLNNQLSNPSLVSSFLYQTRKFYVLFFLQPSNSLRVIYGV
jgi:hypothetical protein